MKELAYLFNAFSNLALWVKVVILVLLATTIIGVAGFFGASSMERLPVERALTAQVRAFTELSIS